ncbi:CAP domain-containing protein [Trametes punicea]|nr:CAP domain-containing protein [Trametes punicea]
MNRLVYLLLSLPLFLTFITNVDAGPACARRNQGTDACVAKCKDKWGWPGHVMGTDRWGQVVTKTLTDAMGAVITQACRVRPSSTGSASASQASTTIISSSTSPLLIPPSTTSAVPANAFLSASASSAVSAAPSVSLLAFTHSESPLHASTKASLSAFLVSTTAPASKASSTQSSSTARPTTSSATERPTPFPTSTSHSETPHDTTITVTRASSSAKQPAPTPDSSNDQGNPSGGSSSDAATSQSDIDQYLQAHNSVRAQHGAAPLTWSDDLAAKAQEWANNCVFQHSGGKLGPFGENLAAGTGSSYGFQAAIKSWTDEVSQYDPNNPQPSHFTQVVWKSTTQVGCAMQSCNGIFAASFGPAKFFVCEYSPQGNVIGEFAQNVQV